MCVLCCSPGRGKVYRPANPVGTVPLLLSLFDRTSIRLSSNFRVRGWANISGTAEPRLRLGSDGEAADRREDKFVPQLRRACRSKSCLLGISSSSPPQVYKTINREQKDTTVLSLTAKNHACKEEKFSSATGRGFSLESRRLLLFPLYIRLADVEVSLREYKRKIYLTYPRLCKL